MGDAADGCSEANVSRRRRSGAVGVARLEAVVLAVVDVHIVAVYCCQVKKGHKWKDTCCDPSKMKHARKYNH